MLTRLDRIDAAESARLFSAGNEHVPVPLRRPDGAQLLWLNRRVMRDDPAWQRVGGSEEAYARHLLDVCAVVVAAPGHVGRVGHADRYGGQGIGRNGGSGRAIVVDAYHVKGIGRTPLIGVGTDVAHASGGAYLEECVRETIFAEIAAAEYPHGAIPTLAIIDTGLTETWPTDAGPKTERRCLLVRPNFLRPAHFERAEDFRSGDPHEGMRDSARVRSTLATAAQLCAEPGLPEHYRRFWQRWAEQLAYGFVHRLPHCAQTTSNVCLGGQLLDFGSMTAVPCWARIDAMPGADPTGAELETVMRNLVARLPQLARHLDPAFGTPETLAELLRAVRASYAETLRIELLRVFGFDRAGARRALAARDGVALSHELWRLIVHWQRERFAIFGGMPPARDDWSAQALWEAVPPPHLTRLRALIETALGDPLIAGCAAATAIAAARGRCALRALARPRLFRDAIKQSIYAALERRPLDGDGLRAAIDALIRREVAANRRDAPHEPPAQRPIGHALAADGTYALHEEPVTGRRWAWPEWEAAGAPAAALEIARLTPEGLELADRRVVAAVVVLHEPAMS